MHITDPVADMLTRVRNANNAKHETVDVPASNMKKSIAQILLDEGYIKSFTVEDDGIGISPEILENILTSPAGRSGIGIKNVHERIQLTFGPSYGLQIESEEDEGTLVTIRLPRYHGEEKT